MDILSTIGILVVSIIIIIVLYKLYKFFSNRKIKGKSVEPIIQKIHDAKTKHIVNYNKIPASLHGNEYSICFWIYINNYSYRLTSKKSIMYLGSSDMTEQNPSIYLHPNSNRLTVKVNLQTDNFNTQADPNVSPGVTHETTNPLASDSNNAQIPIDTPEGFQNTELFKSNISGNNVNYEGFQDNTPTGTPDPLVEHDQRIDSLEEQVGKIS